MSSQEKIDKAVEDIDRAKEVFNKRFPTFTGSLASSPLFAEIVRYFLEEEAEDTKQLLKD